MLAGIYYGAQYGGTITSVLLRLPGEASSVVTVFDGFALAKQGRAGTALGIAAIGSFVGATISIVGLTLLAPVVASVALDFGPPEYAALALLGVLLVATIGSGNKLKAMIAGAIGLLLATVGRDNFSGASRFTFDSLQLADGIDFVVVAMGLFGVGEILYNLEERHGKPHVPAKVGNVWPSRKDLRQSSGAIGRGSVIGFFLGVLPGGGAVLSSIVAYAVEKRRSKTPERFGRGAVEGVAAPETANNAAATSSFIPLLTIGLPANATLAMLFGALLILGVTPGPQLIEEHPDIFWGVINSMYIGNLLLLILSIPLVGIFVKILRIRPAILAPITALITLLGVYTINNSTFDIFLMIAFGVVGYLMKKAGFDPGPMVLAFVLGSIIEASTRRSLLIFDGDPTGFLTRPISGTILAIFVLLLLVPAIRALLNLRKNRTTQPTETTEKAGTR
jgi:putative tricarboxylic transport membrane protein